MTIVEADYKRPASGEKKGVCRVVLCRNGKTKTVALPVKVYACEWDEEARTIRTEGFPAGRSKELLRGKAMLEEEVATYKEVVSFLETEKRTGGYTLSDVLGLRERWKWKDSFFCLMEYRIRNLRDSGQYSTADNYHSALAGFKAFRRNKDLQLSELTGNLLKEFQKHLQRKGLSMNTISLYNRNLRAVYNYALDEELLTEDKHPFHKVFTGVEKTRKRAVKSDVVRRLIRLPLIDDLTLEQARDVFLFCIYTQGMAFVDVAHLTVDNLCGSLLTYKRHKTGQSIRIELPVCARDMIQKYRSATGSHAYLFPLLYNPQDYSEVKYATALREYNRRLHLISGRMGLSVPLSSYVARHTWASIAKQNGVAPTVISEAMGHNNINTTIIYLDELDVEVVSAANRIVVDCLVSG